MNPQRVWSIEPPLPEGVRSALLFGGAFDPPHRAHVELPEQARRLAGIDWLIYIPAAQTPLKSGGPYAPGDDRLAMLRVAVDGSPRASVSDVELARGGRSYTADTLRELKSALPADITLRLLIGADQAAQFQRWREPETILELAEPLVMLRPPVENVEEVIDRLRAHWTGEQVQAWRRRVVELPLIETSSTEIRRTLREEGPDDPSLRGVVPAPVLEHIRSRGLYRASKDDHNGST